MTDNIIWYLNLSVNDGKLDDFKTLVGEMASKVKERDGVLGYEWYLSEDGKSGRVVERFADSDAALGYLGFFVENFAERFGAAVNLDRLDVLGPANDALKEALAGLANHYFPLDGFLK